jgi:hypothetical protein
MEILVINELRVLQEIMLECADTALQTLQYVKSLDRSFPNTKTT